MAHAAHHGVFGGFEAGKAVPRRNAVAAKPGILQRVVSAVAASRQRHADRAIADFIERSGGRLTDGLEREMTERFLSGHMNFRR
jgi:hypothetical protein